MMNGKKANCSICVFGLFLGMIFLTNLVAALGKINEKKSFEKKIYQITGAKSRIKIDGLLNEDAWQRALLIPLNYEIFPGENVEPPVKTECLLTYNNSHLYVAFRAFDPEPSQIRAHFCTRDQLGRDDVVGIVLDTFNDENSAFVFIVNPLGVQRDFIYSNGGRESDDSWDAIWDSAGKITGFGYVVEVAIPFRALQFQRNRGEQTWGFELVRAYPRNQYYRIRNYPDNRNEDCLLCKYSKIKGLKEIKPGKRMELDPTIIGIRSDERDDFPGGLLEKVNSGMEVGISGHWGMTSNLTLSGAINPDFSQVEADAAQLDINTQFALYYPEKRPFFLEGLDFFQTFLNIIYTRSIADPDWGVKLSGKAGKNAIGFFTAQDRVTNLLFPGAEGSDSTYINQKSYSTVLRYRRDIGSSSTLGLLITDREGKNYHNRIVGVDGLIRVSKSDMLRFQLLGSDTLYPEEIAGNYNQKKSRFPGRALSLSYYKAKRSYFWEVAYDDFSPGFRADLGFMPQVDFRQLIGAAGYIFWGKTGSFIPKIGIEGHLAQIEDNNRHLLERGAGIAFSFDGPMQSFLLLEFNTREKVFNTVSFNQFYSDLWFDIRPSGNLYLNLHLSLGDEIDYFHTRSGKKFTISPIIIFNPGKHLSLSLNYTNDRLNVEEQQLFSAQLAQINLIYHLNKRIFVRGIVQYTDIKRNTQLYNVEVAPTSKGLFTQFLFSYQMNPRTVLFLGYTDDYLGYGNIPLTQTNRTFFVKIGYALAL